MSSQWIDGPARTFSAGATLTKYSRVVLSAGVLAAAGAAVRELGVVRAACVSGDSVGVVLRTKEGTTPMIAAGAITAGAKVYAAASGKVAATGAILLGEALEAATADGDVIEVLRTESAGETVASVAAAGSAQGDAAALTANATNTVSAADGTKGVVLPAAVAGITVRVYNEHASNGLKVYPATGDDINDGTTNAAVTTEGKTLATFVALDDTTWAASFTANT